MVGVVFLTVCFNLLNLFSMTTPELISEPQVDGSNRFVYEYKIMERLVKLEIKNANLKERVSQLETAGRLPAVAVKVRRSANQNLAANSRVMYDVEMWNIGDAFNLTTGQFVAPVTGIYFLDVQACLNAGGQWMDLDVMKDGAMIGRVFSGDSNYHSCGSEAIAIRLQQGEKVWVQRTTGVATVINQDHGWNSFTAVLVSIN